MAKPVTLQAKAAAARRRQDQITLVAVVTVAVVVIFAVLLFFILRSNNTASQQASSPYADLYQGTTPDGLPIIGDPSAKVIIMEFADFSCPHCLEYHDTIVQVIDSLVRPGKVRLAFRPVTFVGGQYSEVASQTALCAMKQYPQKKVGFWDMEDELFTIQSEQGRYGFKTKDLADAAGGLGFDENTLLSCVANGDTMPLLQKSIDLSNQYQVTGTPTVFISTDNGQTYNYFNNPDGSPVNSGGPSFDIIQSTVSRALGS